VCKVVRLTLVLLISAVWLQAQSANPSSNAGQTSGKTSNLTTLTGCLQISDGHYILTEDNGTPNQLSGAASKLGHQTGHRIEVTGKPGIKTIDSTSVGAGSSVIEQVVFEVKSVKQVADTCKSPAQ